MALRRGLHMMLNRLSYLTLLSQIGRPLEGFLISKKPNSIGNLNFHIGNL